MALVFRNRVAARRIFERWRERFGAADKDAEISLSIVRKLADHPPAHYAVQITSALPPSTEADRGRLFTMTSRVHVMEPADNRHLERFLSELRSFGYFALAPGIIERGDLDILTDLVILKHDLAVVNAAEVGEHDIQNMAVEIIRKRDAQERRTG